MRVSWERSVGAAFLIALLAACAKVAPPPGGPVDLDPPRILGTTPADDSVGVGATEELRIVFSEGVDKRSVMRALRIVPPVDFRSSSWSGDTLRLVPEETWATDRPTIVWIGDNAEDSRGNRLASPVLLRFTVADSLPPGSIEGRAWVGREKSDEARLLIASFPAGTADSASAAEDDPESIALPDETGAFRLTGLAPGEHRVVGFLDTDADARAQSTNEIVAFAPETALIQADRTRVQIADFLVGTLDSTGTIAGDARADSGAIVVEARADSAETSADARAFLPSGGAFELRVPTGRAYFVSGFADADRDSALDEGENRAAFTERISLELTTERHGLVLDVRSAAVTKANSGEKP